jgi:hypothetical protein
MKLALWNPMDGQMSDLEATQAAGTTTAPLRLKPVSAAFFVQNLT